VAELLHYDPVTGKLLLKAKNKFNTMDNLELMLPEGNNTIKSIKIEDKEGNFIDEVPGSDHEVYIPIELAELYKSTQPSIEHGYLIKHF
jgi:hypothetical protein